MKAQYLNSNQREKRENLRFHRLLLLLACVCSFLCGCNQRHPNLYLIPDKYVGWVQIDFGIPEARPLPKEGRFLVVNIPKSGVLTTSSPFELGWAFDEYYYVSDKQRKRLKETGWGKGGMIWNGRHGSTMTFTKTTEVKGAEVAQFFVGTEEDLKDPEHSQESVKPGPRYPLK